MSLQNMHLRKLLKIMYASGALRTRFLRADIREDIARENGAGPEGGGDFYGPFWKDAKDHVFEFGDLHASTAARIAANFRRANLYPRLRDGFLLWWTDRRRWTNTPFEPIAPPKTSFAAPRTDATIKIANILAVRDGRDEDHFVYPYWFDSPMLTEEAARVGLWVLTQALPKVDENELRILDVIRGQTFSLDRNPLSGNESTIFRERYRSAVADWDRLRIEYG